jgi:hypothetical protein
MMRGRRDQSAAAGSRRIRRLAAVTGSPFDFSTDDEERVDPVEFLAIRADDELLDGLSTGLLVGPAYTEGCGSGVHSGYADDQHVLALLAELRAEIDSVPFPELVMVDEACDAIAAGRRAVRPRRRLMSLTAAAAVTVMALSGVALAAGNAQPGDALWGVSAVLDANRARSVEAAYRVDTALATARQALAEGRVAEARATLASVTPDLDKVSDPERKVQLSRTARNLTDAADEAREGERVQTDEHGAPSDPGWAGRREHGVGGGSTSADPGTAAFGGRPGPESEAVSRAPRPARPDPSELFGPGRPGYPGGPAPASPQPAPANPAEGTLGVPSGAGTPGFPGAGTPGFPGFPGRGAPGVPGGGTPGTPGTGTPGNPGGAGKPSPAPGTPTDPRTGKPTGSEQKSDPKHGQPAKSTTTGTTTPPANSSGCAGRGSGNGCTGSGGNASTGN